MNDEALSLDPARCALIVQDLQNDVMSEGGAWEETGAPQHAKEQNVVENVKALAETCRSKGIPVIHVHYIVEAGAPGLKLNAPLFQGVKDANALVRGSWGAAPAEGLEPQDGVIGIYSGEFPGRRPNETGWAFWSGTSFATAIVSGIAANFWAHRRTQDPTLHVPEDGCSTMSADWHNASINYALQNVATVTTCGAVTEAVAGVPAGV